MEMVINHGISKVSPQFSDQPIFWCSTPSFPTISDMHLQYISPKKCTLTASCSMDPAIWTNLCRYCSLRMRSWNPLRTNRLSETPPSIGKSMKTLVGHSKSMEHSLIAENGGFSENRPQIQKVFSGVWKAINKSTFQNLFGLKRFQSYIFSLVETSQKH